MDGPRPESAAIVLAPGLSQPAPPATRLSPPSLDPLLAACAAGDPLAFRDLFLRYQHRVYSIALHYTADPAAAMDISQDVFLKLFTQLASFRGHSAFDTWLYRLIANCCHDRHRRHRRLVPLDDAPVPAVPENQVSGAAERESLNRQVQQAVAALPEDLRMTVVLRYTEGLAYDQIAAALNCPPGTVALRLNRAHRELAVTLKHLEGFTL